MHSAKTAVTAAGLHSPTCTSEGNKFLDDRPMAPAHPRSRSGFSGITFFKETSFGGNCGIRLSSAWASDPQLGLVARCGARAQIHFRGLCHWAGELTARQAAEPPSRRAADRRVRERQEIEPASSTPTPRTVRNAPSEMACPYAAVLLPPFISSRRPLCTRLAICSGDSHPVS